MTTKLVFMFSGQGSQYFRMGEELYRSNAAFKRHMQALDRLVVEQLGQSVIQTIYGETGRFERAFDQILLTHPALFMVQYSLAQSIMEEGIQPDYVLGSSLGEWVAVAVAGMLPPEQALAAVIQKAILFEQRCPAGGMLAVLSNRNVFDNNRELFLHCEFAAASFSGHFCVSGDNASIDAAERSMQDFKISCEKLPLKQPFHSSLVEPLYGDFLRIFDGMHFSSGNATLVSSAAGGVVEYPDRQHFWDVIRRPIDFYQTALNLSVDSALSYVDLGPSGTLANFIKYGLAPERYQSIYRIMTPAGRDLNNYTRFTGDMKDKFLLQRA